MSQLFSDASVLFIKLALLGLVLLAGAGAVLAYWRMSAAEAPYTGPDQPIPFSHKHHVGDDGIDCRYCHTTVETSAAAGMPATQVCLTCHSQLFKDAPAFAPLHASVQTGQPVPWKRVYDLPDFVYFDHSIHVAKGVACVTCHGRVDQMPRIVRAQRLDMQWCLDCHRAPGRRIGPHDQVFVMHDPAPLSAADVDQLKRIFDLESRARMTSCTTCHR
ncbi:cytochrome C [Bordetella petrii]|nr:cytochrome C [Bordetella petrii]